MGQKTYNNKLNGSEKYLLEINIFVVYHPMLNARKQDQASMESIIK